MSSHVCKTCAVHPKIGRTRSIAEMEFQTKCTLVSLLIYLRDMMNSKATLEATEKLAKELGTIRYKKIKKIKSRLSSGDYHVNLKLLARNLFVAQ